jgi:hypothetical protein
VAKVRVRRIGSSADGTKPSKPGLAMEPMEYPPTRTVAAPRRITTQDVTHIRFSTPLKFNCSKHDQLRDQEIEKRCDGDSNHVCKNACGADHLHGKVSEQNIEPHRKQAG